MKKISSVVMLENHMQALSIVRNINKHSIYGPIDRINAEKVKSMNDLIAPIEKQRIELILILAHSQRWGDGKGEWAREPVRQKVKNVGKRMLKGGGR